MWKTAFKKIEVIWSAICVPPYFMKKNPMLYHDEVFCCSVLLLFNALCEKCPNTELYLSVFSRIRTEYGELQSESPYLVRIRENMEQKQLLIWTHFHAVTINYEL